MKKIIGIGIVLMLMVVGMLSGCLIDTELEESIKNIRNKIETTSEEYVIGNIGLGYTIGNGWKFYYISVYDDFNGIKREYNCRYNYEKDKLILGDYYDYGDKIQTNDSWIRMVN